ncbi:MAG TPA: hypothetical protein VFN97_22425 [Actinospica sp.]|nr:hypothetical protein [Actinospica sp.]
MKQRRSRYPGLTLLVVLSFLTALFAAGVPDLVQHQLTKSLQQTLGATGPVDLALTAQGPELSTAAEVSGGLGVFAHAAPAATRPLTGQAWGGARLGKRLPVVGAYNFTAAMILAYRDAPSSHLKLLAGKLPDSAGAGSFDIALSATDAKFYGARVGTVISTADYQFHVTGIVEPTDPASAFWNYDADLAAPSPIVQPDGSTLWTTTALVGPDELSELAEVQNPNGTPDTDLSVYCVPLDTAAYTAADVGSLLNAMTAFGSGTTAAQLMLQVTAGPSSTLNTFQSQRTAVDSVLSLIMVGVATVGCATILLCARLVVSRRRGHFTLLRARGQSLTQLALQVLRELGPLTLIALVAAGAVATVAARGANTESAALYGGVALIVLGGPPLLAVLEHRGAARLRGDDDHIRRRPKARRRVFELILVLLAAGTIALLRQSGLGGTGQGSNLLGALAPILVAAVTTAVAVRFAPLLLAPAVRAARRRKGATAFLGLSGAVRSSLNLALPTFAIVLALTLAALGGLAYRNIESGRETESWLQTGTDVSIALSTGTAPSAAAKAVAALDRVPGVTASTAVASQSINGTGIEASAYAVDPSTYDGVSADTPWPLAGALPARSVSGPVPVVASADSGYTLGSTFQLTPSAAPAFEAKVVAVQAQSPARPAYGPGQPFVLIPTWAVASSAQFWLVSEILVSGNGIDPAKVNAALAATVPGQNHVVYRGDALDRLTKQPLAGLAAFGYVLGLAAAGCFGICGILLALALTAAPRTRRLTLLGTLGLSPRQARGIALAETAPLAAATTLGGLLAALVLPAVFGSALNLTVFTGLATETGLRLDAVTPLLTAAAALALTCCGVLLQAAIARRRSVPAQLRMGEDA